jgi:hypothetical protein
MRQVPNLVRAYSTTYINVMHLEQAVALSATPIKLLDSSKHGSRELLMGREEARGIHTCTRLPEEVSAILHMW